MLLVSFVSMTSLPALTLNAEEWEDPNHTTFGDDVSLENNADGQQTEFTITSDQTTIGWQDLQQPDSNTLTFTFTNPNDQSTVLNYIGAQHPSNLNGTVECDGCTVAFSNPYGIYIGGEAVLDVGNLALIAGEIDSVDFLSTGMFDARLEGSVINNGRIGADGNVVLLGGEVINNGEIRLEDGALLMLAGEQIAGLGVDSLTDILIGDGSDVVANLMGGTVENNGLLGAPSAALIGARVVNRGEILIAEGTLQMVSADTVHLRRFDDPVSIQIPRAAVNGDGEATADGPVYGIENEGLIDAGLGHVRLSAADPLGFSIRQGTGGSITAKQIEIEGGETGRVELSGRLDASDDSAEGTGGEIDVTGSIVILADANLDASGTRGGGTIQLGGEQEGGGELQRAQAVLVDEASTIHADALHNGDGGRVIAFSEGLTSIDGTITAKGGSEGGDGGFVETSGLARFGISKSPDVSAPNGNAGDWLIDPFDICISSNPSGCGGFLDDGGLTSEFLSLNDAVLAILSPDFDESIFDGIIRTEGPSYVDPNLLGTALAVGTNITLSTQAFGSIPESENHGNGDITIEESILIPNGETLDGTSARLTLLAAGNIAVDADILAGGTGEDPNLALDVFLIANDISQDDISEDFTFDRIRGDVVINGDIRTGGGEFLAQGIAVHQDTASTIETFGGDLNITSGSINRLGGPDTVDGSSDADISSDDTPSKALFIPDPDYPTTYTPVGISLDGTIDTSEGEGEGGDISLSASSINVKLDGTVDVVTAALNIGNTASVTSGGGDIDIQGGAPSVNSDPGFGANVQVEGTLNSCATSDCTSDEVGGDIMIDAHRVDPSDSTKVDTQFVEAEASLIPPGELRGQGGSISIDVGPDGIRTGGGTLEIGGETTQQISIDGELSTQNLANTDEQGLISIVASDRAEDDEDEGVVFGDGQISIGTLGATTLSSAGITIESRRITTSNALAGNPVLLSVSEPTSSTLDGVTPGELRIAGSKSLDFGVDTSLSAESVILEAATSPLDQSSDERIAGDPALAFRGDNGPGGVGVQINAESVAITIGDGTTSTTSLFAEELVDELGTPTDFAVERNAYGTYAGLQLESLANPGERPEEIAISQDAAFTLSAAAAVADSELNLSRAFDGATIGANGMRIELESSDGVLTIADAAALNNDNVTVPDSDASKSWVTLLGGLLLPDAPDPVPSPGSVMTSNSVVFGDDGGATPLATPIDAEALFVSSAGDMSIDDQVAQSIGNVNELTFEAGRNTEVDEAAGRGTITVGDDANDLFLNAGESLAILAGASGFGDLVFESTPTETITLSANDLWLRAGAGASNLNSDSDNRSLVRGLVSNDIDLVDAAGNAFGSDASPSEVSFRYQQDAEIDAATDLPGLDQFGLAPATGFRDARDVVYSVQSDAGAIDLDDDLPGTNEGDRFRDSALRLIGTVVDGDAAIQVSDDFGFEGNSIEIGATRDFRYTQELADAFNRSAANPDAEMTIRSGVGGEGDLGFDAGTSVVAARINLMSGDGIDGTIGSSIDASNATFDLSGAGVDSKVFVFHQDDSDTGNSVLPTIDQFVGGLAGAPDIMVIRSDSGVLSYTNLVFANLPIDTTGSLSRLVLEADSIELTRDDSTDLDLESPNGLKLRLRANNLLLTATDGDETEDGARVLLGSNAPSSPIGNDASFNAETLLIEGFDLENENATIANLSALSAGAGGFNLLSGRGPTSLTIQQDGSVESANLPNSGSVSGHFDRTLNDDDDDEAVATNYSIRSLFGPIHVAPEKVENSDLTLTAVSGTLLTANESAFFFAPGDYVLSDLDVITEDSIVIPENSTFTVDDSITLSAGLAALPEDAVTDPLGSIRFEWDGITRTIDLTANQISLTAGPPVTLTQPDSPGDGDKDPDLVADDVLPRIDIEGINQIRRSGDSDDSSFAFSQNAALDLTVDFDSSGVANLAEALAGGPQWESVDLLSVQGELSITSIDLWSAIAENLTLESGSEGSIVADLEGHSIQFGDFSGDVLFFSNDITIKTEDPIALKQLDLGSPNIEFRSTSNPFDTFLLTEDERFLIRDNPDAFERPIVRIQQVADFDGASQIPLPDQYTVEIATLNPDFTITNIVDTREDLTGIDIELGVTGFGETLTLDDEIRERVLNSNLILKSAGDVAIDLDGPVTGFGELDAAALFLSSLDIRTNYDGIAETSGGGNIFFSVVNFPTTQQMTDFDPLPMMIETTGDQRFDGNLALQTTMTNRARDLMIKGDVIAAPSAGLDLLVSGEVNFQGNIGAGTLPGFDMPLQHLTVLFEDDSSTVPNVQFGIREDLDGDDIFETPIDTDQTVNVEREIVFQADNATADEHGTRDASATVASIGKALGDLTFNLNPLAVPGIVTAFTMGTGEKLSVGGTTSILGGGGNVRLGDVSTLDLIVIAQDIELARRSTGTYFDRLGETQSDAGPTIVANTIRFEDGSGGEVVPTLDGRGKDPVFGVPNPFDPSTYPSFLNQFALFEIRADGRELTPADFQFESLSSSLASQVPALPPTGSSRSDLSGSFGPELTPPPYPEIPEPDEILYPDRLAELGVEPRPTPSNIRLARLNGAAVIDDTALEPEFEFVSVTESRLDARDVEAAIALYEELFGADGERTAEIRSTLQNALDRYLEETRARRVIGFELRRFVKNRPSTLIKAYDTLESLDDLFRFHRRLGLSAGEYRQIQREWLREIQPDGITLDELSETIHPSRYVRGSDILDIFGR